MADVERQRRHWARNGPPVHIAVAIFASAWGVRLTVDEPDGHDEMPIEPFSRPSIADLAARITPPVAGGDTLAASLQVARAMKGVPDGQ